MKKWHIDQKKEKQVRKNFTKVGEWPKILIVTEKLLTRFDAPVLYAIYLQLTHEKPFPAVNVLAAKERNAPIVFSVDLVFHK